MSRETNINELRLQLTAKINTQRFPNFVIGQQINNYYDLKQQQHDTKLNYR